MESICSFSDKQCQHNYPPAGAWQALCGAPGWSLEPGEVKSLKYHACAQKRASRNSEKQKKHKWTQKNTHAFLSHKLLLRAPLLHAPGARMTVVKLTPSNNCIKQLHHHFARKLHISKRKCMLKVGPEFVNVARKAIATQVTQLKTIGNTCNTI